MRERSRAFHPCNYNTNLEIPEAPPGTMLLLPCPASSPVLQSKPPNLGFVAVNPSPDQPCSSP
jgi:hypothetical protein